MNNINNLEATGVNTSGGNDNNNNNNTLRSLTQETDGAKETANAVESQAREDRFNELFGAELVAQFESQVIERQVCFEKSPHRVKMVWVQWNKTKDIILKVGIVDPSEWEMNSQLFYFAEPIAVSYFQSVLLFLNKFGRFVCQKQRLAYTPVKMAAGPFKQKMVERHAANGGKAQSSKPLTPALLGRAKRTLKEEHYNYLFITLWLGLRPSEVDRLRDETTWKIETADGMTFLTVKQKKLIHMAEALRWKSILICEEQQERALALIKEGKFRRPFPSTMKRVFGEGVYLYAGRKGFGAVMMEKEYSLDAIRQNLGHADVKTTKQFYMDAEKVRLAELRGMVAAVKGRR